jgi:hypothetical protein
LLVYVKGCAEFFFLFEPVTLFKKRLGGHGRSAPKQITVRYFVTDHPFRSVVGFEEKTPRPLNYIRGFTVVLMNTFRLV